MENLLKSLLSVPVPWRGDGKQGCPSWEEEERCADGRAVRQRGCLRLNSFSWSIPKSSFRKTKIMVWSHGLRALLKVSIISICKEFI